MLRSIWAWLAISFLVVAWLPLLAAIRVFDRDPAHYRTGYWFRRLGRAITRVNPAWKVIVSGYRVEDPRRPYVVVSNHQSFADIPVISCLPWEMKWVGKAELFRIPVVGWMMRLAGDLKLERGNAHSGMKVLLGARDYLRKNCSVIFFPEGTRSRDGSVGEFSEGAFRLAIKEQVPILPLAVEGTRDALLRDSWRFGPASVIRVGVLPPIETAGLMKEDTRRLTKDVRERIIRQIDAWRELHPDHEPA